MAASSCGAAGVGSTGGGGEGRTEQHGWARLEFGDGRHVAVCTATNQDFCIGGYRATTDAATRGQYAEHYHAVMDASVRSYISSRHCLITRLPSGQVVLTDMSTNGRWINDQDTPVKELSSSDACAAKQRTLDNGDCVKLYKSKDDTIGTPPSAFFTFNDLRRTSEGQVGGGSDRPKRDLEDKAAPNDQQSKKHKQPSKEEISSDDAKGQSEAESSMNLERAGKALDPTLLHLYQKFVLEDDAEDLARLGIKKESDLKYLHKNAHKNLISQMKLPFLTEQKLIHLVESCGQHEQAAACRLGMKSEAREQVANVQIINIKGSPPSPGLRMSTPPRDDNSDGIFDDPIAFAEKDNDWLQNSPNKHASTSKARSIKYFAPGTPETGKSMHCLLVEQRKKNYRENWKSLICCGKVEAHGLIKYKDRTGIIVRNGQTLCIKEIDETSRENGAKGSNSGQKRTPGKGCETSNEDLSKKQKKDGRAKGGGLLAPDDGGGACEAGGGGVRVEGRWRDGSGSSAADGGAEDERGDLRPGGYCSAASGKTPSEGVAGVRGRDADDVPGVDRDIAGPAPKWYEKIEEREDETAERDLYHFSDVASAKSISSDDEQVELESSASFSDYEDEEEREDESARSMQTLQSMGFCDTQQNGELLSKCGNDLNHVIEELYSVQDQGQVDGRRAESGVAGGCALELQRDPDASPGAALWTDTAGLNDTCLPESVKISVKKFHEFRFAVKPVSESYQEKVANFFKGGTDGFEEHDWSKELDSLRQTPEPSMDGRPLQSVLSVWQAVGYKHAQRILSSQTDLKGCLFWWTPGSGKSIMVALLIELLQISGKKIIVVSTPQNIKQNGLRECVKILLRFSPTMKRYGSGTDIPESEVRYVLKNLRGSILCKDFCSFQQFYTQYKGKDMRDKCLIIDECHELFNNKLKHRDEIYKLVSSAQNVFTLSGTPWRNINEMERQLELFQTHKLSISSSPGEGKLRKLAAGCVSYVDGTQDRSKFPINGGWRLERCYISEDQLYNFSTRCHQQLSNIKDFGGESKLQNACQVADKLRQHDLSESQRRQVYAACRTMQCAGGAYWGSEASGLCKILASSPFLDSVGKFAPKFKKLCAAVQAPVDALNTKHFVYSSYQTTITNLVHTLNALQSDAANPIFKQLNSKDFEWHGQTLKLKSSSWTYTDNTALVFVNLKGNLEDRKTLMAAFGYVTPDGERFEGLGRPGNEKVPLVQMMLGCRESNQGLTLLRLQHIHILEPNPKGWGQIVQTIGRGIRRGTHEGVSEEQLRIVTSTIYVTSIEGEWVEKMKQTQLDEVSSRLKLQLKEWHSTYDDLKKLEIDSVMVADPTKIYLSSVKKQEKALRKNLRTLTKNIYKLFSDKRKLEGGWLKVQTGKMSQKDSSPKTTKRTMVKIFDLFPDEAIFMVTWGEEESRIKFDKIIRDSAVDDLLFKDFLTAKSSPLDWMSQLREKFERVSQQSFDDLLSIGNACESCPCSICGNTRSAEKNPSSSVVGVKCEEDHFVCSTCYLSFHTKDKSVLSIKDAQRNYRQDCVGRDLVKCCASSCAASFLVTQTRKLKFPLYWKIKQEEHFRVIDNHFMEDKIQTLIRSSVRSKCDGVHGGCKGVDGDGTGTASAVVTKVLRIENGRLWKQYWEKKSKMIAARRSSPIHRLPAKSKEVTKLFPSVQVNEEINELFLFHGTKEEAAQSIAESGFDPKRGKGIYGTGSYCADYSCKAMQYAGGRKPVPGQPRVFLICRVLMGEAYQTKKRLCDIYQPPEKCDSVFAGEGSADDGHQQHNEYITYDSDQMYPEYLVYVNVGGSVYSPDDFHFGCALYWMFSINKRATAKGAESGSTSTWALDSHISDGPTLSPEEIQKQITFGGQSRRGRTGPVNFGAISSDTHAKSCFEIMLTKEQNMSGEWAVFYHSYSKAALLYEVQAAMGAVLFRFHSEYAPLPRLFRGCFADLPDAPAVLKEFPSWPDRDGSDRFKSVGICATVSLLAHDTEAPATEVFLDGYSVGTLSTAIIENMLRECGNEDLTAEKRKQLTKNIVKLAEKYGLDVSAFGGKCSLSGKPGHLLQIFMKRNLVDKYTYAALPYGVHDTTRDPLQKYLALGNTELKGQARIVVHPSAFLRPTKVRMYSYSADKNFQERRQAFQKELTEQLKAVLGSESLRTQAAKGIFGGTLPAWFQAQDQRQTGMR